MLQPIDSAKDPAGTQYRASVTQAVTAANGVTVPQGAAAIVTLVNSGNGSGWTTQLISITLNGQPTAVTSAPATVTSATQSAAGSAMSTVSSMLGSFGHHVKPPTGVTAVAMGQRVVLPPGSTLTFLLSQPPAAAPAAPGVPAAQTMTASASPAPSPAYGTAPAAPSAGPVATTGPGQNPWLCMYYGQKDAHPITYVSPMVYTGANPSQAFMKYLTTNYDLSKIMHASGHCDRYSSDAATRANSMDMLEKQWAASKTELIHVAWTDSPAENAAATATLASAAAAAAVPTAAANQNYIFCHSAWAPGTMAQAAASVMYVSDIFPEVMPPPLTPSPGHPLPPNANGALINKTYALQASFFRFLQKQYGFKDSGNYPTTCATTFPPTAGGLQSAKNNKQTSEEGVTQLKGQIVETGWKNQ
jgi:hypothetical protein